MKQLFKISLRLLAAALVLSTLLVSCKKDEESKFGILSMSLTLPSGQTIECTVDQAALAIDNSKDPIEPGLPASMMQMTITYTATIGAQVSLNGAPVVSGQTAADFSQPVQISVAKDGKTSLYTVTIVTDANDKSETEGKKVNSDMRTAGFPEAAWYDIVYFKDAFWAITSSYPEGTGEANPAYYQVFKSTDGIKWEKVNTSLKAVGAYGAKLVVFNDKLFALGGGRFYGTDEDGNAPELLYGMADISQFFAFSSADGVTWEKLEPSIMMTPPTGGEKVPAAQMFTGYVDTRYAVAGGKLVYLGGLSMMFSQFQNACTFANTSDGINWDVDLLGSNSETFQNGIKMWNNAVVYTFKDKIYALGGFKNYLGEYNEDWINKGIWSSTDGLTWTLEKEDAGFGGIWGARVAGTDDVLYMVGGETQTPESERKVLNKVWRSTDGINWTELSGENAMAEAFEGRMRPCVAACGDMLWIFGGRKVTSDYYGAIQASDEVLYDTWKKRIK